MLSNAPAGTHGYHHNNEVEKRLTQILDGSYQTETPTPTADAFTEEFGTFADYVSDITPYKQTPITPRSMIKANKLRQQYNRERAVLQHSSISEGISEYNVAARQVAPESTLSYKHENLPYRVFEQLRAGNVRWQMAVDLHQSTIDEARQACMDLIAQAQQHDHKVVKITHGKGINATLKTHVNLWLEQHSQVLAFHSCIPQQGGTGAVLVLLKKAALTD